MKMNKNVLYMGRANNAKGEGINTPVGFMPHQHLPFPLNKL